MCGYKLATNWQNFTEIFSLSEHIAKSYRQLLFFDSFCRCWVC